jgi:hypothetical protein
MADFHVLPNQAHLDEIVEVGRYFFLLHVVAFLHFPLEIEDANGDRGNTPGSFMMFVQEAENEIPFCVFRVRGHNENILE